MSKSKTCDGCGKELKLGGYLPIHDLGVSIDIAPGVSVFVCRSAKYSHGDFAKSACLSKAMAKHPVCAGCGGSYRGLGICSDCKAALERGKTLAGQVERATVVYEALFHRLDDEYEDEDFDNRIDKRLGRALLAAILGPGCRRVEDAGWNYGRIVPAHPKRGMDFSGHPSEGATVEITKAQADALEEMMTVLSEVFDKQRLSGRAEGKALLVQLARGEVTAADFEDKEKELEKL